MLNHTINLDFGNKIYGMINMEAIPKFDIKSVIKSDIKFDISTKLTTWIGHEGASIVEIQDYKYSLISVYLPLCYGSVSKFN